MVMLISNKETLNSTMFSIFTFNYISMKSVYYICLFILLAGCSASPSMDAPENFTAASQTGLAIGTITFEGDTPKNDIYRFFYSPVSADKKFTRMNDGKIQILGRVDDERTYNGDFNNSKTYLFAIERQPGQYAFTQYNFLTRKGPTGMVYSSNEFAIPFEIKKGEISYIGELTYMEKAEKGTPRLIIADYMMRDIQHFKQKFPHINWDIAINRTPKNGNTGNNTVDFR